MHVHYIYIPRNLSWCVIANCWSRHLLIVGFQGNGIGSHPRPFCILQLVYDGIPKGDLHQRELHLSVLSEEGFWENILLGEVMIRLRDLDLAQEKMGWFELGSRSHGTMWRAAKQPMSSEPLWPHGSPWEMVHVPGVVSWHIGKDLVSYKQEEWIYCVSANERLISCAEWAFGIGSW